MTATDKLIIRTLAPNHEKSAFRCGNAALDRYIARQAGQDIRRQINRVFVAVTPEAPNTIVGYYSLSAFSIDLSTLPRKLKKKLPRHPIPAALLGRLAVSDACRGRGIGKLLMADAVKRCLALQKDIAVYALVVDPANEKATAFYEHFGFCPLDTAATRLFLPLREIPNAG